MEQYKNIVRNVLNNGQLKNNRTGIDTIAIAGSMFEHDMSEGFPLLTTKYVPINLVASELEFFIKGLTDKNWLKERNNHIWDEFSFVDGRSLLRTEEERKIYQLKSNDLGCLYGYQWSKFNSDKRIQPPNANIPYKQLINTKEPLHESQLCGSFYELDTFDKEILIQFKETGFTKKISKIQFESKVIKDPYYLKYYNVACTGVPDNKHPYIEELKSIWINMISQCYNKNSKDYNMYGEAGVRVSNDWLIFEYFLEDVLNISGSKSKIEDWDNYYLDKDIIGNGFMYSKEYCKWEAIKNQSKHKNTSINHDKRNTGLNQLKTLVSMLKTNPNDRRMIVSAWNPIDLHKMALPPCHYSFQVTVINDKLNLMWNQRSVDVALGLPFNIASYGLLLLLLAKETGFKPGKLIGFLGDVHIYENHIEKLLKQIERHTFPLPELIIYKFNSIFDWQYIDIFLGNYDFHPAIKYEIAV